MIILESAPSKSFGDVSFLSATDFRYVIPLANELALWIDPRIDPSSELCEISKPFEPYLSILFSSSGSSAIDCGRTSLRYSSSRSFTELDLRLRALLTLIFLLIC